ncbi:hypothetical protein QX776_08255 [Alteromonadaceae bacterium BrNp21-10]|nr:hypothetical protein [Alteromonadaceae bacterium BrNp21-10]
MKNAFLPISRRKLLLGTMALAGSQALPAFSMTNKGITTVIDAKQRFTAVSPYIYGGFIEHIGNLINHSLWSEVLDDRKFYYDVLEKADVKPADRRAAMRFINKWTVIGSPSAHHLDTTHPYVGEHSPVIDLQAGISNGIAQDGLSLEGGKTYNGRIVLAKTNTANVTVTLISGTDQQKVKIKTSKKWHTAHFQLTAGNDTTQGRIEITAEGKGSLRIGAISLMPADNVRGFRADTIALMREMDCKMLRMPGGNFISAYDWKDTVGDPDKRPPVLDPVWSAVQPNDVGVDELIQMCELIKCEPYWCVNTGFGEPRSGAELVEYVNGSKETVWGAKRAANGHTEPYKVKYWNIGNEMYGHWQRGHMSRDHYVTKHNLFADAMRKVDPNIYIVAPGGFVDEMTTGQGIFIAGQPQVKVGSDRDWAYGMLQGSWGKFDALATHAYPPEGKRFNLDTGKLFDVDMTLLESVRQPPDRVRTMVDAWVEYKKAFPELEKGAIKVFFDEWAYHFQDDLKGSLAIALTLHEFYRHTDFIDMAGYTMATAWIDFNRTLSTISTKGRIFQLFNKHYGTIPIAVDGNSPQPAPQYPIGGDQPSVNSGSATYPLDVSASLTDDGATLVVSVVNATESEHSLDLSLQSFSPRKNGTCWKFTGASAESKNQLGKAPEVIIKELTFNAQSPSLYITPFSVEIYHFSAA